MVNREKHVANPNYYLPTSSPVRAFARSIGKGEKSEVRAHSIFWVTRRKW